MLQMTPEEQVARIRARHEGTNSEDAVEYMKVAAFCLNLKDVVSYFQGFMQFWENAEPGEPKTMGIKVTPEMTPGHIVATILEGNGHP